MTRQPVGARLRPARGRIRGDYRGREVVTTDVGEARPLEARGAGDAVRAFPLLWAAATSILTECNPTPSEGVGIPSR